MANSRAMELSIKIAGQVDSSLNTAISQATSRVSNLANNLSKIGTIGLAAMTTAAVATVKGLANCVEEAQQLETDMAGVVRYVDGLADVSGNIDTSAYQQMKGYIQDLSTSIPRTTEQIAAMSAALGQSGKGYQEQMTTSILQDTAMAATAMDLDDETAGNYMAKWEAAFQYSHDNVMELMDQINYLGANYATTAAEIAASVNDSASLGQIAGVDPAATAAIAASMQAMGVDSGKVATSVNRIYQNISKGSTATAAQKAMWQELGFTAESVASAMQTDGIGTLKEVFAAIGQLPEERKVAALNTLFGQWAIEGSAKITQNLELLTGMLEELDNADNWNGSMMREFVIQAETTDALDTMMQNAKTALMQDIGEAMLPAKKQWDTALIDFYNTLRNNTPALTELTDSLASLARRGIEKLASALEWALPRLQTGLDWLAEHTGTTAALLAGTTAGFAGLKAAPVIAGQLTGTTAATTAASGGSLGNLVRTMMTTSGQNGTRTTLRTALASLIGGNGLAGTAQLLETAAARPGLLTGYQSAGDVLRQRITGSRAGQYLAGVSGSLGNLGRTVGNTRAGSALTDAANQLTGAGQQLLTGFSGGLATLTAPIRQKLATTGAGLMLQGNILSQSLSGALGRFASSGMGQIAGAGAGVLGSIWAPLMGSFGSLFASAAPVVAVIGGIVAGVSLLGDHLDVLEPMFTRLFGEEAGTEKLEALEQGLKGISGAFETLAGGGVANALAGVRENLFGEGGIFAGSSAGESAFDGLTTLLQAGMTVAGEVVDFGTGTVKPILEDVLGFLGGTVVPGVLNLFGDMAPELATILTGLGSGVMAGMELMGAGIQAALPIVETIVTAVMKIADVAAPAVAAGLAKLAEGAGTVMEGMKTTFGGLISFVTGVFTGNWETAWNGVKTIFGGAFEALGGLVKAPMNAVIATINKVIEGINGLGLTIPEWVPELGGKRFSVNLPTLPMLKYGGFTNGVSIAGEAGPEAVISFQSAARNRNIAIWQEAGNRLGVTQPGGNRVQLKDWGTQRTQEQTGGNWTFAPQIVIQGNADEAAVEEALRRAKEEFETWYDEMQRRKRRTAY